MERKKLLSALAAARENGSFQIRIVFTTWAEAFRMRFLVIMISRGAIAVDDDTMMRLWHVAITRKWEEDVDRIVTLTLRPNFDASEFATKFRRAVESIEIVPATSFPVIAHEGLITPTTAIRRVKEMIRAANDVGQVQLTIIIPRATDTDFLFFMDLVKHGYISFVDQRERLVFETVAAHRGWSLGGRFSAEVLINKALPEHDGRRALVGAHAQFMPNNIKVMR